MIYSVYYRDSSFNLTALLLIRYRDKLQFCLEESYPNGLLIDSNIRNHNEFPKVKTFSKQYVKKIEPVSKENLLLYTVKCKNEKIRELLKKELKKIL